jgi:hypothetical protein
MAGDLLRRGWCVCWRLARLHAGMRLIGLTVSLALSLTLALAAAEAQAPERSVRVGLLTPGTREEDAQSFLAGMRDLGYIEGRNLVLEYRRPTAGPSAFPIFWPSWSAPRSTSS